MTTLKIGADPELFVFSNGNLISGHTFPCGSKETPMPVANGHVQNDGMALEFNVPPAETKEEFVNGTIAVLTDLARLVKQTDPNATLKAIPVADFGEEVIKATPEFYSRLGCNPDFNAYTGLENPVPNAALPFRTGSGHVHIGWTEGADGMAHFEDCCKLAKELDYFLGLPSILWDPEKRRRELYGKAGAFRPKPYGMEYRVLSNAWLKKTDLMEFVYDRTVMAFKSIFQSNRKPMHEKYGDTAKKYIDGVYLDPSMWTRDFQGIAQRVLNNKYKEALNA